MTVQQILLKLGGVFILIAINAFFVTAEFAIVSVRRSKIDHLVNDGDTTAQTVQSLQHHLDKLLSTTQFGITLSSLALGWIGEQTIALLLQQWIISLSLPTTISDTLVHSIAIPTAFICLVYLQIVLGELCPKSLALLYPEKLARLFAPPISVVTRIFNPFVFILNQSTRWLLKLVGVEYTRQAWHKQVTPEELQLIIQTEKDSLGLEAEERQILKNVLEFGDVEAVEVMTPRININFLDTDSTYQDLVQKVASTKNSRFPVIGESLDDILGIIDFKLCICELAGEEIDANTPLTQFIKPVRFVKQSTLLSDLLTTMQNLRLKMVVIVDKYGGTSGLVTRQDLIKEILGNEVGEDAPSDTFIEIIDDSHSLVSAQMNVDELNDALNLDLPINDNYHTLGGFLVYHWQKIPQLHEVFYFDRFQFEIVDIEGPRIKKIKITLNVEEIK